MAVVRTRSAPPYGAFAGFFLFGIAAVLAVVFYFMWAGAATERDQAIDGMKHAGSAADMSAFQSANPADPGKPQSSLLAQAKTDLDTMRLKLSQANATVNSQASDIVSLKKTRDDADERATQAQAAQNQATKDLQDARAGFAKEIASLNDQNDVLNKQVAAANAERDAAVQKGQEDLNKQAAESADQIKKNVLQIEQDKNELAQKDREIQDLRVRIVNTGHETNNANVGTADSTVLRVNQATGEAYILLGKNDRIVPGLTFTAYDPRLGVRYGSDEQAEGNGSMEVIEVGATTSLCRITHITTGKAIQAGDLIANPVYHNDRTRQYHFVVRGDFDLDGDGVATAAERDRIVRLIQAWGGKVDDKVSPQTDFIVMGDRPKNVASVETGDAAATAPASEPEPGSIADQRKKEQDEYDGVIVQGKSLGIPVLNSNRFLEMIGYYNTTIVRYDNNMTKKP